MQAHVTLSPPGEYVELICALTAAVQAVAAITAATCFYISCTCLVWNYDDNVRYVQQILASPLITVHSCVAVSVL